MLLSKMNRVEMEMDILLNPELEACFDPNRLYMRGGATAYSDAEMVAIIGAWIEAGDECA